MARIGLARSFHGVAPRMSRDEAGWQDQLATALAAVQARPDSNQILAALQKLNATK